MGAHCICIATDVDRWQLVKVAFYRRDSLWNCIEKFLFWGFQGHSMSMVVYRGGIVSRFDSESLDQKLSEWLNAYFFINPSKYSSPVCLRTHFLQCSCHCWKHFWKPYSGITCRQCVIVEMKSLIMSDCFLSSLPWIWGTARSHRVTGQERMLVVVTQDVSIHEKQVYGDWCGAGCIVMLQYPTILLLLSFPSNHLSNFAVMLWKVLN